MRMQRRQQKLRKRRLAKEAARAKKLGKGGDGGGAQQSPELVAANAIGVGDLVEVSPDVEQPDPRECARCDRLNSGPLSEAGVS